MQRYNSVKSSSKWRLKIVGLAGGVGFLAYVMWYLFWNALLNANELTLSLVLGVLILTLCLTMTYILNYISKKATAHVMSDSLNNFL